MQELFCGFFSGFFAVVEKSRGGKPEQAGLTPAADYVIKSEQTEVVVPFFSFLNR